MGTSSLKGEEIEEARTPDLVLLRRAALMTGNIVMLLHSFSVRVLQARGYLRLDEIFIVRALHVSI